MVCSFRQCKLITTALVPPSRCQGDTIITHLHVAGRCSMSSRGKELVVSEPIFSVMYFHPLFLQAGQSSLCSTLKQVSGTDRVLPCPTQHCPTQQLCVGYAPTLASRGAPRVGAVETPRADGDISKMVGCGGPDAQVPHKNKNGYKTQLQTTEIALGNLQLQRRGSRSAESATGRCGHVEK